MKKFLMGSRNLCVLVSSVLCLFAWSTSAKAAVFIFDVPGTVPWYDTGIDVFAGNELSITATGLVFYDVFNSRAADANGGNWDGQLFLAGAQYSNTVVHSLLGRIGGTINPGTGTPVPEGVFGNGPGFVGTAYDKQVSTSGRLFLGYNDGLDNFQDNSGSFHVTVTVVPEPSTVTLVTVGLMGLVFYCTPKRNQSTRRKGLIMKYFIYTVGIALLFCSQTFAQVTNAVIVSLNWVGRSTEANASVPKSDTLGGAVSAALALPLDPNQVIFDDGFYHVGDNPPPSGHDSASWAWYLGPQYQCRHLQATFTLPAGLHNVVGFSLFSPYYTQYGNVIPINDNAYFFLNGSSLGHRGVDYGALNNLPITETDGWNANGDFGSAPAAFLQAGLNTLDFIAEERSGGGATGRLNLVLLDVVPEPQSFVLVGSALLTLICLRRKTERVRRHTHFIIMLASLVVWAGISTATTVTVTVPGTAGPWLFNGGLNSSYQYTFFGYVPTGPTVVSTSDGFNFTAGDKLSITYISGLVSAGPSDWPYTDGLGTTSSDANGTYGYARPPSLYMNPALGPYHIGELVGTFANGSGQIVGTPFGIGNGGSFTIPAGATRLQLGVNDTILDDNAGSWNVMVGPEAVPEPTTLALVLIGVTGIGLGTRRRV
jgi:PEP-CTERM motif